jgi:photosystem II stability/assembly factor-like uncharacterized protein
VIVRQRLPLSLLFASVLVPGLSLVTVLPGLSYSQEPSREQQLNDLQKQIDTLNKKLEELRRTPATGPTTSTDGGLNPEWVKELAWRSIGPASMGGRIVALAVYEADPCIYYVATASGGLLKTVNNGVTFQHQFDHESTVSIGDVCVAPTDPNVVWVGTGEANPRNSVSFGDGVYKSTDGGKSWKNMGLKKSFQIGKIIIHPKNPNIVYVGALGRLYGPNEERGLFKTVDGGTTWQKILYVDDKTGIIDMRMSPADPETLIVATYERQRDGFDTHPFEVGLAEGYDSYDPIKKWAPGTGLYKTTDGGKTFHKLTKGLPTCLIGRIGLDWYRKDPKTVFAIIDSEKIGMGPAPGQGGGPYLGVDGQDADAGAKLTKILAGSPAEKAGLQVGDIIVLLDSQPILSFRQLAQAVGGHKVGDKLTVKAARNHEAKEFALVLAQLPTPPAATKRPFNSFYGGQRENAQNQQGPEGYQNGGVYKSMDGGESWTRLNSVNPRPMYFSQIRVDPTDDKYLYVLGIELYRSSDAGKTFRPDGGREVHPDQHTLWIDPKDGRHMIVGCDGGFYVTYDRMANWDFLNHMAIGQFYHVSLDNRKPYNIYGGLQDNSSWGGPSRTLRRLGPINEDWILLGAGDGFVCQVDANDPDVVYWEFQDGNMFRRNLRTGHTIQIHPSTPPPALIQLDAKQPFLAWASPVPVMPLLPNPVRIQQFYRFNWNTPYILSSHNSHIFYAGGNHVFRSLKQGEDLRSISPEITRTKVGTATALAESPRNPEVVWAGTDDGYLWVTRDGGVHWTNVTAHVGLPGPRWVASIECSRFLDGRAYVAFDGHRSDDDEPYVYVTEDFGQTWKSLRADLPAGSSRVLREDVANSNLLFLGTEFAVWVSTNRGGSWTRLNSNLPTVAVHELAIHPTAGEMVAATHGRSLWVLDVTPLRQMTAETLKAKAYLYQPNTAVRWRYEPDHHSPYGVGMRRFVGENPPQGTQIYYSLTQKADKLSLKIVDYGGKTVRELRGPVTPGLHKISWNLSRFAGGMAPAGTYRAVLSVDGQEFSQSIVVENDPVVPNAAVTPPPFGEREKEDR